MTEGLTKNEAFLSRSVEKEWGLALDPDSSRARQSVPSVERFALSAAGTNFNPLSSELLLDPVSSSKHAQRIR